MVLPISKVRIRSSASIHTFIHIYLHTTIYASSITITIIVIITIITIGSFTLQRVVIKAIHDSSPSSSLSSQHDSQINPSDSNSDSDSDSKHFVAIVPTHASFAVITSPHGEMTRLRLQLVVDEALPASSGRVVVISNLCDIVSYGKQYSIMMTAMVVVMMLMMMMLLLKMMMVMMMLLLKMMMMMMMTIHRHHLLFQAMPPSLPPAR